MRIERSSVKGPSRTYRVDRPAAPQAGGPVSVAAGADKVDVSDKVRQAGAIHTRLLEAPEVRAELVERLRSQIESGNYKPDVRQVAERLLKAKVLDE